MFRLIIFISCCSIVLIGNAQNFSGQWKGSFDERRDPSRTEYVLEIETKGNKFEGTSVTYFNINGKRCYTMCAIKGTIDPGSKTITSQEVSKIKANTPSWFVDCFQTHILTYYKNGNEESLIGTWKSARKEDNCGTGSTKLSRKVFIPITGNTPKNKTSQTESSKQQKEQPTSSEKKTETAQSYSNTDQDKKEANQKYKPAPVIKTVLEKREDQVFETLQLQSDSVEVSLFDNAEIDGDIITLLFNGEVVLAKQTLSDKPITVRLKLEPGQDNVLTMYAENQGNIPPNTAIMRIKNEENYHKILLSADDKKNGSVILRLK
jgi:hypothetical protein